MTLTIEVYNGDGEKVDEDEVDPDETDEIEVGDYTIEL